MPAQPRYREAPANLQSLRVVHTLQPSSSAVAHLQKLWAQARRITRIAVSWSRPRSPSPATTQTGRVMSLTGVDFIIAGSEKGEDRLFKSLRATLDCQLFSVGLNNSQQRHVDYAQLQWTINYKEEYQVNAVQQIIDLVAVEPPMVVVTRLIDLFNRVSNCTRTPAEASSNFVTRFAGLASEHLMQAGSSPNSKVGESGNLHAEKTLISERQRSQVRRFS